jgi:hypothetical protein
MTQQYFMNKGNNNFKEVNVKLVYRATSQCVSRERNIKKEHEEREREKKQRERERENAKRERERDDEESEKVQKRGECERVHVTLAGSRKRLLGPAGLRRRAASSKIGVMFSSRCHPLSRIL